jgi:hypothetical protein
LTQGRVAEVFVTAWKQSEDRKYLDYAERLCRIMSVPVPEGGLLASDVQGNVAIEEFSTEPPHWALNGIGSAINSLEHVANFVDMPWEQGLIERVCKSIDAKIDLFDDPDYPGSRVQLAIKYDLSLKLVPSGFLAAAGEGALTLRRAWMKPWFSPEFEMDVAHAEFDKKSGAVKFESILDANRDPQDAVSRPQTTLTFDVATAGAGMLVLATSHNGEEVHLGEVPVGAGDQHVTFNFDVAERLPRGIGRVAKFNETYHETNLAWMWQLSRYGAERRNAFVARRWLYSFLSGKGRMPLAGSTFDQSKLLARKALRANSASAESDLPAARSARAEIATIEQILSLASAGVAASLSHLTPSMVPNDRPVTVRLYGFGFNGSETVSILSASGDVLVPDAGARVVSGDEITVELANLPIGEARLRVIHDGAEITADTHPLAVTVKPGAGN